ncbi:MAG: biopolymer transporter ExbD [Steroidobacteraceae bacterium]
MSMNVSSGGTDEPMCDVNTTPLIDVMLVLLVMLIVTLPVQNHAVKLDMPIPRKTLVPPPPSDRIVIEIDSDGTIVWDGTPISGIPELDSRFEQETIKDPQPEIHLRPARRSKYDVVANVMASAQRHKMEKLGFANVSEFAD